MENKTFNNIRYFTVKEVAEILNENVATIRFWMKEFKDILNIEFDGKHKKLTDKHIQIFQQIQKLLRKNHYSVEQIIKHYENIDTEFLTEDVNNTLVDEIVAQVSLELKKQLDIFKNDLLEFISSEHEKLINIYKENISIQKQNNDELKEFISHIVTESIDEKFNKLEILQQLKTEQQKNQQLKEIILELKTTNSSTSKKDNPKKKNLFDMF